MANQTDLGATSVHGMNPQFLIDKITRQKIYNCLYWKEKLFGASCVDVVSACSSLRYMGGCYGGSAKPSKFLCAVLKMLQLQPEEEIVLELLRDDYFRYLRAAAAFYYRLTASPRAIYENLEPLYADRRKLNVIGKQGWDQWYMDDFIDALLHEDHVCDTQLPRLPARAQLEKLGQLTRRVSPLEEELQAAEAQAQRAAAEEEEAAAAPDGDGDELGAGLPAPGKRKRKKKKGKEKGFSKLFKKAAPDGVARAEAKPEGEQDAAAQNPHEKFSVEWWNVERSRLGMKPLKS